MGLVIGVKTKFKKWMRQNVLDITVSNEMLFSVASTKSAMYYICI